MSFTLSDMENHGIFLSREVTRIDLSLKIIILKKITILSSLEIRLKKRREVIKCSIRKGMVFESKVDQG